LNINLADGTSSSVNAGQAALDAATLKRLAARRDVPGLARLLVHIGGVLITGSLLYASLGTLLAIPLTIVHGIGLAFLFCAEHESAHYTAFRSRWMNTVTGHLVAFILMLPFNAFKAFHWDHHRFTQDPKKDPELANGLPSGHLATFWLWLGWPNWSSRLVGFFRHGIQAKVSSPWIPTTQHGNIIREARLYLLGYLVLLTGSVLMGSALLVWLWLLPVFCGYWFLRPYLLSEHTGCANDGDMYQRTRTIYTNRLVHWLAWNMPYHTEHHRYPAVPFHALPDLHEKMSQQLVHTSQGYHQATRNVVHHLTSRQT
jgi:fatty acid desaturase